MVDVSRSSVYYKPKPVNPDDLKLMRLIDEQYMKTPSWGSRSMRNFLRRKLERKINRKRIQRLMRLMGLEAIYPIQSREPADRIPNIRYIPIC